MMADKIGNEIKKELKKKIEDLFLVQDLYAEKDKAMTVMESDWESFWEEEQGGKNG
jgi:hypothetical protein